MQKYASLYLIPTLLGDSPVDDVIPHGLSEKLRSIKYFIVEDLRTARRFLKKIDRSINIDDLTFFLLNEHSKADEIHEFIAPLLGGDDMGLMSEAGTPCVADPGASLVSIAHSKNIRVVPLSGPSSITLALMASGFNGQQFIFHGYLPKDRKERIQALKRLEQDAFKKDQTQIFIETPYRNMQMFESITETCRHDTLLCIAADLTTQNEMVRTLNIAQWKKNPPAIHKKPAVFLIYKY